MKSARELVHEHIHDGTRRPFGFFCGHPHEPHSTVCEEATHMAKHIQLDALRWARNVVYRDIIDDKIRELEDGK